MLNKLSRTLMVGFVGLSLMSCLTTSTSWKRPGVSPEQFIIDKEYCRSLARIEAEEAYKNSIKYGSASGINSEISYNQLMQGHDARRNSRKIFEGCLSRRGYEKINSNTEDKNVQESNRLKRYQDIL